MSFTDKFNAKYNPKSQNLPIIEQKKPILSNCYSCECYEAGAKVGRVPSISWCVFKYFDRIKKRSIICYRNIELMECCPKVAEKKQYKKKF